MAAYYAITNRAGQWQFVCAGRDPQDVYQQARALLDDTARDPEESAIALSPMTQRALDTLRVVPASQARTVYHVVFPRVQDGEYPLD